VVDLTLLLFLKYINLHRFSYLYIKKSHENARNDRINLIVSRFNRMWVVAWVNQATNG